MRHPLSAALLAASACGAVSADTSNMQPGLWEITTEATIPGMPMQPAPQTMQHCYTADALQQAQNAIPQTGDGSCKIEDYRLEGNTATWALQCAGDVSMHGSGTMTSEPTRYSGQMKLVIPGPGGTVEMTTSWRAERIGDCR